MMEFISTWLYRIMISPLLLIMLVKGKKNIYAVGDMATWKGMKVKITRVGDYHGHPVVDFEATKAIIPMEFTGISTRELS